MPTLPMMTAEATTPDAWHSVTAPGGYEWWYFDAEDTANDLQVVAILFQGFVFHPGYLRRHARYLRAPTRVPPAVPAEYPCAYLAVYQRGKVLLQFMTQYAPQQFAASRERVDVTVGPNRLTGHANGSLQLDLLGRPWDLTWQGPKTRGDARLTASLRFEPVFDHPPMERVFLSREMTGADHQWVLANPLCRVSGQVAVEGPSPSRIDFTGRGYHDHNYGTGPIGPGLKRWIWGRVLLDDRVTTFHFARSRDARLADEVHVVEADGDGMRETPVSHVEADWSMKTALGLAYPAAARFGDALELRNPRLIDPSPFYMRLMYDAVARGRTGQAFCEIAYPHRLRWPVLGRMIEMSLDRLPTL